MQRYIVIEPHLSLRDCVDGIDQLAGLAAFEDDAGYACAERVASYAVSHTAAIRSLIATTDEKPTTSRSTQLLTERERDVLHGILDGLINKEIASKLQVSASSIKAVIQEFFHKAGARTRSQLVQIAIEKHSKNWLG
jgi:DNA-binding NarL/FixJ family response regulator